MLEMSDFIIILLLRSANYAGIGAKFSINYRVQGTLVSQITCQFLGDATQSCRLGGEMVVISKFSEISN